MNAFGEQALSGILAFTATAENYFLEDICLNRKGRETRALLI